MSNKKPDESSVLERSMKSTREILGGYLDMLEERYDGNQHFVESGFSDLDDAFPAWLHDGHLIVVAARPGMGKTSLVQQIAEYVAKTKTVLFFTLEMSNYELIERSISRLTGIEVSRLKTAVNLDDDDFSRITKAVNQLANLSFYADDHVYDVDVICSKTERVYKKINARLKVGSEIDADGDTENDVVDGKLDVKELGLVVVDYLQLATGVGANKTLEIGDVSTKLKKLAKKLQIPVIGIAQLNRGVESRQDKRPMQSDLRESGQIEQDADGIIFIYRDEVYNAESSDKGVAEIICSKNRHGATGTVRMAWIGKQMKFADLVKMPTNNGRKDD